MNGTVGNFLTILELKTFTKMNKTGNASLNRFFIISQFSAKLLSTCIIGIPLIETIRNNLANQDYPVQQVKYCAIKYQELSEQELMSVS